MPALGPDYTAGFMGFYQSAKGSVIDMDSWQICLVGPRGLHELVRSWDFAFRNLTVIELPDNLEVPLPAAEEESKDAEGQAAKPLFKLKYVEEMSRVAFRDSNVTIYPVRAESNNDNTDAVISYYCVPTQ